MDGERMALTELFLLYIQQLVQSFVIGLRFQSVDVLEMKNTSFTQKQIWIT